MAPERIYSGVAGAARVDDRFKAVRVLVGFQGGVGMVEVESSGDEGVEVDLAAGDKVDGCRPGVGVAVDARDVDP